MGQPPRPRVQRRKDKGREKSFTLSCRPDGGGMGPSPGSLTAGLSPPLRLRWLCLDRARKAPGRAPGLAAPGSCAPLTQECGEDLPPQCSRPGPRVKLRVLSWGPGGGAGMQPCNTCLHWPAGQRPNRSPPPPVSLAPALPTTGFSIKLSALPWPGHGGALLPRGAQQGRRGAILSLSQAPGPGLSLQGAEERGPPTRAAGGWVGASSQGHSPLVQGAQRGESSLAPCPTLTAWRHSPACMLWAPALGGGSCPPAA